MKISTSIYGVLKRYDLLTSCKVLAAAGFEAIDYSVTQNTVQWEEGFFRDPKCPEFAEYFRNIGKTVRDGGVEMYQCHAPYARPFISDPEYYAQLQKQIIRSIYAAGYMGCPNIVAHPVLHIDFCDGKNKELARQTTLDYFSAMVPALKGTGVTMCIENLFCYIEDEDRWTDNFCSSAEDLCDVIDTLNQMHGPHFAACLDTGHAVVTKQDPAEMLGILGNRIKVLHVQDNQGEQDDHLIPTEGIIDWKKFATALGEIDYQGTFNFEVSEPFCLLTKDTFSRTAFLNACDFLYSIGRSLADIAEGKFVEES